MKQLIAFHDMIADMLSNIKLEPIVIDLIIRCKKVNTSVAFITQSYFAVPLNKCKILEIKIPNKRELQQIVFNNSSAFGFNDFMKLYKKSTNDLYLCLVSYDTLPSDSNLRFRCDLFEEVKQRN